MRQLLTYARGAAQAAACLGLTVTLGGCEPVSLTLLGIGGSAAVNHQLSSMPSRTFTVPFLKVKNASLIALEHMGISTEDVRPVENGEVITARVGKREIEVELESVSAHTTRMRVVARNGGFFYDGATATEIIVQTEKRLGG
jgi:hypothetical protein